MMTSESSHPIRHQLRAVRAMLFLLNQLGELRRLIAWAERQQGRRRQAKKFAGIRRSYERRADAAAQKLFMLRVRFPRGYWVARLLHAISNLTSVQPVRHRGAAAHYGRSGR